jgi:predicted membrane metal-binding protein
MLYSIFFIPHPSAFILLFPAVSFAAFAVIIISKAETRRRGREGRPVG